GEQRHRGAQPAHANPQLMYAVGIVVEQCRFGAEDLLETGAADRLEGLPRAHAGHERDKRCLDRRAQRIVDELVAALRFALQRELRRRPLGELARNREQPGLVAALELELYFAQRRRALASVDLATIDCEHDRLRAIHQWIGRAPHASLEQWFEPSSQLVA